MIRSDFVRALLPYIEPLPRCPEVEIGLGIPRDPIRIVKNEEGGLELYQLATGRFYTQAMREYCGREIANLPELDGALLKEKSPSCGPSNVKIYTSAAPNAPQGSKGRGFWADALITAHPALPVENEGRLYNFEIREHFYTAIFTRAAFRAARSNGTTKDLVAFHAQNKLLFLAYNQAAMRDLGRIVANPGHEPVHVLFAAYEAQLARMFQRIPRRGAIINVLLHAFGYCSENLDQRERSHFLSVLEQYKNERIPLSACQTVLGSWIERFDISYLRDQSFFQPYPPELIDTADSA